METATLRVVDTAGNEMCNLRCNDTYSVYHMRMVLLPMMPRYVCYTRSAL